jgi:hypothetical protein
MKLLKPHEHETFTVTEFQPEMDHINRTYKYGWHPMGFLVVSGANGPEAFLGRGKTVPIGTKFLHGNHGTVMTLSPDELQKLIEDGELETVEEPSAK